MSASASPADRPDAPAPWFPASPVPSEFGPTPEPETAFDRVMKVTGVRTGTPSLRTDMALLDQWTAEIKTAQFRADWAGVPPRSVALCRFRPDPARPADPDPANVWIDVEDPTHPVRPERVAAWQLWDRRVERAEFSLPRLTPESANARREDRPA